MKNNYAAFLALGTILCGGAEVGANDVNWVKHTISFDQSLNAISSSSSNSSLDSYRDDAPISISSPTVIEKDSKTLVMQILGTPPTDEQNDDMTLGGLLAPVHRSTLLGAEQDTSYIKATKKELKNLTNKGSTVIENVEDLSITLNTFLDIFKDAFNQARTEAGNQLKDTAEDAVKFLLDALKDQAVVWGESAKNVMNQLVSIAEQKYPTMTNLLISQLKNIKFTEIEGKLVALVREKAEEDTCCGCLARSALSVYQYYKSQGQDAPIVLPKETTQLLKSGGFYSPSTSQHVNGAEPAKLRRSGSRKIAG